MYSTFCLVIQNKLWCNSGNANSPGIMSQSDQKNMNVLFQMCSNLIKIWNKKPVNLEECGAMLEKLKVFNFCRN